jgi:hypothetical protein
MSTSFDIAPMSARAEQPVPSAPFIEHSPRRTLAAGELVASYYTSEPEPEQWIAVATIRRALAAAGGADSLRLLVGAGDSEASAIAQLRRRLGQLAAPTHVPAPT